MKIAFDIKQVLLNTTQVSDQLKRMRVACLDSTLTDISNVQLDHQIWQPGSEPIQLRKRPFFHLGNEYLATPLYHPIFFKYRLKTASKSFSPVASSFSATVSFLIGE